MIKQYIVIGYAVYNSNPESVPYIYSKVYNYGQISYTRKYGTERPRCPMIHKITQELCIVLTPSTFDNQADSGLSILEEWLATDEADLPIIDDALDPENDAANPLRRLSVDDFAPTSRVAMRAACRTRF